jgi:Spy/CpxP family protein refolding chaperone
VSLKFVFFAALVAAAIAVAPIATADPGWPVAGAESAADTIRDLQGQGYNVQINWVNGISRGDLSRCSVRAIYNPDRSATSPPPQSTTVYVDVDCPHDHDSGGEVGVGFGI